MEQTQLNLAPQTSLETYMALLIQKSLNAPAPVYEYNTPQEIAAFEKFLLSSSGERYHDYFDSMLSFNIDAFYNKLNHTQWADFHFKHYVKDAKFLTARDLQVIHKYYDAFDPTMWKDKVLELFGLSDKKIDSYDRDRNTYYLTLQSYLSLPEKEKEDSQIFLQAEFHKQVLDKWVENSPILKMRVCQFLIKDYEKNDAFNFVSPQELKALVEDTLKSVPASILTEEIVYSDPDQSYKNMRKGLAQKFYVQIFTTKFFKADEKSELLYIKTGLDKNYFYEDIGRVKNVIRDGTLDDVEYMLKTITFPIKFTTPHNLIMTICDAERVQVGRGIRAASWFLDICEKDFMKGKYLFEFFLPHIKFEFETDKKTAAVQGIDFLVAYVKKKSKMSITMAKALENVETAIINYEKDLLTTKLQMELPLQGQLDLRLEPEKEEPKKRFKL